MILKNYEGGKEGKKRNRRNKGKRQDCSREDTKGMIWTGGEGGREEIRERKEGRRILIGGSTEVT